MANKTTYLNMKTSYGVETVDEISTDEYPIYSEYRKALQSLIYNYHLCGMNVYTSQRPDKTWND